MSEGARERKQISLEIQDPSLSTENKREKVFGNLLTNSKIRDILITQDEGKENPQKTRKATAMKKASLSAIYSALKGIDFDSEILAEIKGELDKGEAQKAKTAAAYDGIHDIVMKGLGMATAPVTCAELYESIKADLPSEMTKQKVQYALMHKWDGEIVIIPGKPNTYRKA